MILINIFKRSIVKILLFPFFVTAFSNADASLKVNTYNLASKQLQKNKMTENEQSLADSMLNYCKSTSFEKDIQTLIQNFTKDKVLTSAVALGNAIQSGSQTISKNIQLKSDLKLNVFLIIGCGKTDAFAIPYQDQYAVFFDLSTLMNQKRDKAPIEFIAHEIIHGVHLTLQPEFAPENFKSAEDNLIRYMIVEGMATYVAALITKTDERKALWVDILNEKQFETYKNTAKSELENYSKRIKSYLKDPNSEPKLLNDLFYVTSMDNLEKKRIGYYYGYSILKQSTTYKPLQQIQIDYPVMRNEVFKFFELKN